MGCGNSSVVSGNLTNLSQTYESGFSGRPISFGPRTQQYQAYYLSGNPKQMESLGVEKNFSSLVEVAFKFPTIGSDISIKSLKRKT